VGIISVLLYVYICIKVALYADAAVNFYYFIVSLYGWYFWKHGGRLQDKQQPAVEIDSVLIDEEPKLHEEARITKSNLVENIFTVVFTFLIGVLLGFVLEQFTDSTVPYWDGMTTAIFITAMWLMAKKRIENWIYWIVGDAACIPLFLYKGLCLSSVQYLIFTVLAIAGYLSWYSKLQKNSPATL